MAGDTWEDEPISSPFDATIETEPIHRTKSKYCEESEIERAG